MKEAKLRRMRDLGDFQKELSDAGVDIAILTDVPPAKARPFSQMARAIVEFAIKQGCYITPFGFGNYIDNINEFHCCPCAPIRKYCPCAEAESEIREQGHCLCRLFWRDYKTFLDLRIAKEDGKDGNTK